MPEVVQAKVDFVAFFGGALGDADDACVEEQDVQTLLLCNETRGACPHARERGQIQVDEAHLRSRCRRVLLLRVALVRFPRDALADCLPLRLPPRQIRNVYARWPPMLCELDRSLPPQIARRARNKHDLARQRGNVLRRRKRGTALVARPKQRHLCHFAKLRHDEARSDDDKHTRKDSQGRDIIV